MKRIMDLEINGFVLPYGFRCSSSSVGCSVANASDANESIIKLTQSSCVAVSGLS